MHHLRGWQCPSQWVLMSRGKLVNSTMAFLHNSVAPSRERRTRLFLPRRHHSVSCRHSAYNTSQPRHTEADLISAVHLLAIERPRLAVTWTALH
ncbi:hypothetical protein AMTR_s00158p00060160 [Amborella trichopoda]|uniref:Uncharacterized protein n=1 Tax=Amborella trichopoda TaxID=13333 RepID=W1PTB4_AMBTC|nr:hypothetical protein AMTR_s00158p00060160 [Amborella trichopoda]